MIYRMDSPDDPSIAEDPYLLRTPFVCRHVSLTTGHWLTVTQQWVILTGGLRVRLEIGSARKRISDDVESSWLVFDGEVVLREERQPPHHALREVWADYGRA